MPLLTSNILGYEADILSIALGILSLIFAIVVAVGSYLYNSRVLKANLHLDFSCETAEQRRKKLRLPLSARPLHTAKHDTALADTSILHPKPVMVCDIR